MIPGPARFGAPVEGIVLVIVTAAAIYLATIVYVRIAGLRSMSKMSGFDFIMTIAAGSIVGSVAVTTETLLEGLTALAVLFGVQVAVASLRRRTNLGRIVDNDPLLLMAGSEILHDNLHRARVTEKEVLAKLREANVLDPGSIQAVVLETTGDVSVLHGDDDLDLDLLRDVRGVERLRDDG